VDEQGRAMVEVTAARLRTQISVKEVQIGSMRTFAANRYPELQMAQHELEALTRELSRIEGVSLTVALSGRSEAGSSGLDNLDGLRDVKYFETIFELLAKQYEIARIDEARDASLIQVLDKAVEPERKSKPKRALIAILTALVAGFLAVIWAFIKEAGERTRQNPEQAPRLDSLRKNMRWR